MTKLVAHIEHFRWRVLQDALLEATAAYWRRRADTFAQVGNARCNRIALNCRRYADLLEESGLDAEVRELITAALAERDRGAA